MTTQTTVPEVMTRQATVSEASQVAGRDGSTQWALKLDIKDISQFPVPCFMPLERAAQVLKGSVHLVTMRRGKMKQGKEGKYPSEYFWDLTGWDVQAPAPVAPQSPQEPTHRASLPWDAADTQSRISWAQAVNLAVECLKGFDEGWSKEKYLEGVEHWANRFYPIIRKGPTAQDEPLSPDAQEGPQEATVGASAPLPGGGGGGAPVYPRKSFPIWDKAKQTDWQYISLVAKDLYQKDQPALRIVLGMSWAEWVKKHETPEAAIQAAIMRLAE